MKFVQCRIIAGLLLAVTLHADLLSAQINKPGGTRAAVSPVAIPPAYTNTTTNYIRFWEPDMPMTDTTVSVLMSKKPKEVKQNTQYFDGLGRPLQIVTKGISSTGKDLVAPVVYDDLGRESYKYIPYVQQSGNLSDGKYKTDPFIVQKVFYGNGVFNPGVSGDSIFYGRVEFEASPLNRQLKSYGPGNSWVNRPIENQYLANVASDSVRIWDIGTGLPSSTASYGAGQLLKSVAVNEQGSRVIEYKDKFDRVVLSKIQLSASPGAGHFGWLCTYYVYDDLGNLRFVIPPLAVDAIKSTWVMNTAIADGLCFQYQYDSRQRMTVKKIPGAGRIFMVYDVRDRLAFTQDSIQRVKSPMEWLVTMYDGLNRPVMSAIYKGNFTRDVLQANMDAAVPSRSISNVLTGKADLALYSYDGSPLYTATNSIVVL